MGHLNISSLRNKLELVKEVIFNNIDVFFLSETKVDETFPSNQFQIDGYKTFRLDRNCYGGGVCMYVNQDIAARSVGYSSISNIESICLELNLRKRKWLVIGIYKPPSYSEDAFIKSLFSCLTNAAKEFDNILLLQDFNMTAENTKMEQLLTSFSLESLIKSPTCFESVIPNSIDLILTNHKQYFMKSQTLVTGISGFHALTLTSMRNTFCKGNPKTKFYRDFKILIVKCLTASLVIP